VRRIRWILGGLGGAAVLAAGAGSAPACGCGIGFDVKAPSERAYIGFAHGREDLVVSLGLSARSHAAVVLPVPATPAVGLAPAGRELFSYLRKATAVRTVIVKHAGPSPVGGGGPPEGPRPVIVGTKRVGGYTVTRLRGGTSATLLAWLKAHGYKLPSGAGRILDRYVADGWSFVAVRLTRPGKGLLAPLRLRFRTSAPVYPLRLDSLSDLPIDLDVWTVGAHRMRAGRLTTDYAGPVSGLTPAVPAALRRYLSGGWVTHFEAKPLADAAMRSDVLPVRAARDIPFRRVVRKDVYTG
jgi:Uncharacterized protein conserved in bacteria (DUF2330)